MTYKNYANRIYSYALFAALPSFFVATWFIWQTNISPYGKTFITLFLITSLLVFAWAIRNQISFQFQTLSNLVEAVRLGDFSLRGIRRFRGDPLSELIEQINQLSDSLMEQRLASEEAYRLLEKTMNEINTAIFAFDANLNVKLANPAASSLVSVPLETLIGKSAQQLGLSQFLSEESATKLIEHSFQGATGKWQIKSDAYRDQGKQRKLLFIQDLRQVLREEELNAWKNLMRVVSHEVNNSLFPVVSLGQTVKSMVNNENKPDDWLDDVNQGLDIIAERTEQLSDFIRRYAKVAKMPKANKSLFPLDKLLCRVSNLMDEQKVHTNLYEPLTLFADESMIEQVLINLIKNGLEAGDKVSIACEKARNRVFIHVKDNGPGINNTANLFVPFYSTKKQGAGIGLVLCRQIVEAHNGSLSLDNHVDGGCIATIEIPQTN